MTLESGLGGRNLKEESVSTMRVGPHLLSPRLYSATFYGLVLQPGPLCTARTQLAWLAPELAFLPCACCKYLTYPLPVPTPPLKNYVLDVGNCPEVIRLEDGGLQGKQYEKYYFCRFYKSYDL